MPYGMIRTSDESNERVNNEGHSADANSENQGEDFHCGASVVERADVGFAKIEADQTVTYDDDCEKEQIDDHQGG